MSVSGGLARVSCRATGVTRILPLCWEEGAPFSGDSRGSRRFGLLLLDGSPGRRNPARGVPGDYQRRVAIEEILNQRIQPRRLRDRF